MINSLLYSIRCNSEWLCKLRSSGDRLGPGLCAAELAPGHPLFKQQKQGNSMGLNSMGLWD